MAGNELPQDVVAFIRSNINSVELLEVLLLLNHERARTWNGESVAAELRIQPRSAGGRLETITRLGAAKKADGNNFRFDEASPLCPVIEQLAKAYQTHRVAIIELIFSRPPNGAEAFANAFLIGGKGKADG